MVTTRWYPQAANSGVALAIPWDTFWFLTPAAGAVDNAARILMATTRLPGPTTHSGAAALKPVPVPNNTADWQGILPAITVAQTISGTVSFVQPVAYIGNSNIRLRIRALTAAGALRGLLFNGTSSIIPTGGTNFTRTVSGNLTPVDVQVGDRIVVEMGFDIASGLGGSATVAFHTGVASSDYAFANGNPVVTTSTPWIELALDDPPLSPINLTQTGATTTSVDIDFDPPATGPVPDSYEYRVNGGAAVSIGASTLFTIPGLTPSTNYTVEVRSIKNPQKSGWASIVARTADPFLKTVEGVPVKYKTPTGWQNIILIGS